MAGNTIEMVISLRDKASGAFDNVGRAAEKAQKRAEGTAQGLRDVEETAGDADSALAGIAGALDLVSPKLGAAVRVVAEMGAAIEGMIRLVKATGPVLLAMGAAAAAGGLVYKDWAEKTERLKKSQDALSESLAFQKTLIESAIESRWRLAAAVGEITERERELRTLRRAAFLEAQPSLQKLSQSITEYQLEVRTLTKDLDDLKEQQAAAFTGESVGGRANFEASQIASNILRTTKELEEANRQLSGLENSRLKTIELMSETIKRNVTAADKEAEALEKAAVASEQAAAAQAMAAETQKAQAAETEAFLQGVEDYWGRNKAGAEALIAEIEQIAGPLVAAVSEAERLEQILSELDGLDLAGSGLSPSDVAQLREHVESALKDLTVTIDAQSVWQPLSEALKDFSSDPSMFGVGGITRGFVQSVGSAFESPEAQRALSAGFAAAAGNMGQLINMAGPVWGNILGGIISVGSGGAEGSRERKEELKDAFVTFAEDLPEIIGEVHPEFITSLIEELIPALVRMIPSLVEALTFGMTQAFAAAIADWWRDARDWFREEAGGGNVASSVLSTVRSVLNPAMVTTNYAAAQTSADWDDRVSSHFWMQGDRMQSGRSAGRSSSARERAVMRRTSGDGGGQPAQFGGAGTTVNISGSLVDRDIVGRLGAELQRTFGTYGRGNQPVLGGT